ncbi:MAG: hypothetical protein JSW40_08190 [Candidatus Omnitrophota bacterium]|nr:MAG: hypothetical protein JSW40_08190 [Candidatus Omnitrophota bacterium]
MKFLLLIYFLFLCACVDRAIIVPVDEATYRQGVLTVPFEVSQENKRQTLAKLGIVYVGMPKEDLEKAGCKEGDLVDYRREGNKEWLTILDWATAESTDTITFVVEGGKVKDWFKGIARK